MKYRMTVNCPQEAFFDTVAANFIEDYYAVKKIRLDKDGQLKGITYQKRVTTKKKLNTGDKIPMAHVQMLEYQRPVRYRMEYKSATYNKIVGIELKTLENGKLDVIWEEVERKGARNSAGEAEYFDKKSESEEIVNPSLSQRFQINRLARYARSEAKKNKE